MSLSKLTNNFNFYKATNLYSIKGCAASDELILETYRQRRQIQLTQSTGKTTPAKKQDDSHLPKPESTCMGEYGPEKKRKDGTFLLKTDYNMYGISHIVTKAAVSYISIDAKLYVFNPHTPVAQKVSDEVIFRRFQGEGVEFF